MIARPSEKQLANDGASEGDGSDIFLRGVPGVLFSIKALKNCIDLANDTSASVRSGVAGHNCAGIGTVPVQVAIREESSTASNGWPTALPSALLRVLQRGAMYFSFVRVGNCLLLVAQELHGGECAYAAGKGGSRAFLEKRDTTGGRDACPSYVGSLAFGLNSVTKCI